MSRHVQRRWVATGFAALWLALAASGAVAQPLSSVLLGDPVDPQSGVTYEILPGRPLVTAGPDGRFGSADDVVDESIRGDIDLVVRVGDDLPADTIPDPAPARGAAPVATAGTRGAGTALPFRVYASNGVSTVDQPYGTLISALDLEGLPVIVLAFADRDGDGFIGPRSNDPGLQVRQIAELDAVGREMAFFRGGIASGSLTVTVGGPASRSGLGIVVTAMAFTGPYLPDVLNGFVPSGPGVTTAQPFIPERDPLRLLKVQDMATARVDYPMSVDPRAAEIPDPADGLALPVDGSSPTVDVARAVAGPAACARLVERLRGMRPGISPEPPMLTLGTRSGAARARLRLVAVDRLGNPTDPTTPFTVRLVSDPPIAVGGKKEPFQRTVMVRHSKGSAITFHTSGAGDGTVRVIVNGAVCQRLAFTSRPERNARGADALVDASGKRGFDTIGAAIAGATDRDGDGRITIEIGEGIFRESVDLTGPFQLKGAGPRRTVIDARGAGPGLTIGAAGADAEGLTVSGGTTGISVEVATTVQHLEAWANVGAGVRLAASGAAADTCSARENGGDGFVGEQPSTVVNSLSFGNWDAGIAFRDTSGAGLAGNLIAANVGDGIELTRSVEPAVTDNASAGNLGTGITFTDVTGGFLVGNRASANEHDGLNLIRSDGALVDGNDLATNDGFGVLVNQSSADFDMTVPGDQAPTGANDVSENMMGPVLVE